MDGAEADIAGWSVEILGSGDYVVLDPARRLRAGATPDPRLDAQCRGALGFDIALPDFSTLSPRSKGLALPSTKSRATTSGPVHLVVDSTGLKVFGEGEWLENKHKTKAKRKRWRKLHLGLNLVSGEIVCSNLTADDVGDPTALPGLLDQIGGPVEKFIADGAYDGTPNPRSSGDTLS